MNAFRLTHAHSRTSKHFATAALACTALMSGAAVIADDGCQSSCSSSKQRKMQPTMASQPAVETMAVAGMHTMMHEAKPSIVETAVDAGSFSTLVAALKAAGLVDALQGDGPFTVFAPSDAAFAELPDGTVDNLLKPENRKTLKSILKFHVVSGYMPASDVMRSSGATTLGGQRLDFTSKNGNVMVNGANVVKANIECENGIIHVIDSVVMPESDNIVSLAQSAGMFGTLLAACEAADLAGVLSGEGPFTVLAPTDEAFAALPKGTVESLLKPENKSKLVAILTYHVIPSRVYANDAVGLGRAATVQGGEVIFDIRDGKVTVDGANIVKTNLDASNGVIHVIDRVIMPSDG